MKKKIVGFALLVTAAFLVLSFSPKAEAGGVAFHIGVGIPLPGYAAPPPVIYPQPAPVVVAPPPPYYYHRPPVVYAPYGYYRPHYYRHEYWRDGDGWYPGHTRYPLRHW